MANPLPPPTRYSPRRRTLNDRPLITADSKRADSSNGLCLNALHDRAFDRGLITFDEDLRLVVSPSLADLVDSVASESDKDPGPLIRRLLAVTCPLKTSPVDVRESRVHGRIQERHDGNGSDASRIGTDHREVS